MARATSFNHFIPTLLEKKSDAIYVFAYCPICDKAEHSRDVSHGQQRAIAASIDKIREHMRLQHHMK